MKFTITRKSPRESDTVYKIRLGITGFFLALVDEFELVRSELF